MTRAAPVITVDGPGGAGKGTISQLVAYRLGWHLLDSGALYRLVALSAARKGVSTSDEQALAGVAETLDIRFQSAASGELVRVWLDGAEVTDDIRSEHCGAEASRVAALGGVRAALVERQRRFRQPPGLVADGRDMGTVVFPDAAVKMFLTATPEERARRRYNQLKQKGIDVNLATLLADIGERDRRDRERSTAPLRPAQDAVIIDTTGQGIDAVLGSVLRAVAGNTGGTDGEISGL